MHMLRLEPDVVAERVKSALLRWGASPITASVVAEHLVDAELAGHPSHGIRQVLQYRDYQRQGCDLAAEPICHSPNASSIVVDAANGLGHVAMRDATMAVVAAARRTGLAIASVSHFWHAGRIGAWSELGAQHGVVTLVAVAIRSEPFSVAAGPGTVPALHTNPLSIAVPAPLTPLLLDIATSAVAEGKISLAAETGADLGPGLLIDLHRRPTSDPASLAMGGALLAFGGHKGFGIGTMVEALAISLTGAAATDAPFVSGGLILGIDASTFVAREHVMADAELLRQRVRASGREHEVLAVGDYEAASRRVATIEVNPRLWEKLAH